VSGLAAMNLASVAPTLALHLLSCIVEGAAIAGCAWLALRMMPRRNAGTRFAVWMLALLAIAVFPWMDLLVPAQTGARANAAFLLPLSWAIYALAAWGAIAAAGLLRIGIGLWRVRKLRRSCRRLDDAELDPVLQATLTDFRSLRKVSLCASGKVQVPTAIGFLQPVVVIPDWAWNELPADDLNVIVLHELAHVRRWDDCSNLVQKFLRAVLFFHPAVWWIENRLSLEREMACDDLVLAQTANPRAYAKCLVSVAERSFLHRGLAMAQAAVSKICDTSLRVTRILDATRPGATRIWKPAIGLVSAFAVVCAVSFAHAPRLIAFEDQTPQLSANLRVPAVAPAAPLAKVVPVSAVHRKMPAAPRVVKNSPAQGEAQAELALAQSMISDFVPNFVLANLPASNTPAQAVFLMVQGAQFDQMGPVFWTVTVWRLPVQKSGKQAVPAQGPAKSI